jgi:CMD domain protein
MADHSPSSGPTHDTIDVLAGLRADSAIAAVRHARDKVVTHTQRSEDALFDPALPDLSLRERLFAAWYVAHLSRANELADTYAGRLIAAGAGSSTRTAPLSETLAAIEASTLDAASNARLIAILAHVKLLTLTPGEARPQHLQALEQAGISTRGIVALSQLIAFVTFQLRVIAGVKALRDAYPPPAPQEAA